MDILDSSKTPAACDGKNYGASPEQMKALDADAHQFNQALKANESDRTGKGNFREAMKAGQAFYDELTQLPVGERKALLKLAEDINKEEQKGDPAMPTIDKTMRQDSFIETLIINYPEPFYPDAASRHADARGEKATHYTPEQFIYQGSPMCAEFSQSDITSANAGAGKVAAFILHPVEVQK